MARVLLTGGAGFIGSHLADRLMRDGHTVTVVDSFDDFYSAAIKRANVSAHLRNPRYSLVTCDIRDAKALNTGLKSDYDVVVHCAARAGVRPSIEQPLLYEDVNVRGTHNMLIFAHDRGIKQFVFASSSSVYGANPRVPWREDDHVLEPISPYASTKVTGELLGHVYSHLYGIRFLALRFFTVYGPRQRPDLAIHTFARRIFAGLPIRLFGNGSSLRDYTYVDDIVSGITAAIVYDRSRYEIFNLGSNSPVTLTDLVSSLEVALQRDAIVERAETQPGDVAQTWANIDKAARLLGYNPSTSLAEGLRKFSAWLAKHPNVVAAQ